MGVHPPAEKAERGRQLSHRETPQSGASIWLLRISGPRAPRRPARQGWNLGRKGSPAAGPSLRAESDKAVVSRHIPVQGLYIAGQAADTLCRHPSGPPGAENTERASITGE